ncbi:pentapeptide repeat-containing protein [Rhodococcus zopfii]|uniref:pentapeptide repeat-containing protein n=1 Tax=Rhodococcus zopfii TaxID=43772 RepID=UPI001111289C|nr:pentapeptide repeat-containing protein [Rhodococcus zopfii]
MNRVHPWSRRTLRSTLRVWVLIGTIATTLLGIAVLLLFAWLQSGKWLWQNGFYLNGSQWFDAARTTVALIGIVGLGGAAFLAYRKQVSTEAQHQLTESSSLRDRYTTAAEQLGNESAPIRLAGVYALASLADDWNAFGRPDERQVCIDLLCAYLRTDRTQSSKPSAPTERTISEHPRRILAGHPRLRPRPRADPVRADAGKEERSVRGAIVGSIRTRTVSGSHVNWSGHAFDLAGANLVGAKLARTRLVGATMPDADLTLANLVRANLVRANLRAAKLCTATLTEADLTSANLTDADLTKVKMRGANLTNARLGWANLTDAELVNVTLVGADLTGATLTGVDMTGVDLTEVDLVSVDLTRATLISVDLAEAKLADVKLKSATLNYANLTGAHLTGVDLAGARLLGANLSGANLTGVDLFDADLTEADLCEARLSWADLTDANLTGVRWDDRTIWPDGFEPPSR